MLYVVYTDNFFFSLYTSCVYSFNKLKEKKIEWKLFTLGSR